MKWIGSSVIFNIIGQVLLYSPSGVDLNVWMIPSGIGSLLLSLLILLFFKNDFNKINGILVSSKMTIIQKYFIAPFVCWIFVVFVFGLLFTIINADSFELAYLLLPIPAVVSYIILRNVLRLKGLKFNERFLYITNFMDTTEVEITSVKWVKSSFPSIMYKVCYEKELVEYVCYFMTGSGPVGHFLGFENGLKELEKVIADQSLRK